MHRRTRQVRQFGDVPAHIVPRRVELLALKYRVEDPVVGRSVHARTRHPCLLYTSDAADERSSVDLGGRRTITKKKKKHKQSNRRSEEHKKEYEVT